MQNFDSVKIGSFNKREEINTPHFPDSYDE